MFEMRSVSNFEANFGKMRNRFFTYDLISRKKFVNPHSVTDNITHTVQWYKALNF